MRTEIVCLMGLCMLGTPNARADQLVWDAQTGNGQADDGGGTWSDSGGNANWWNGSQNVSWPNTSADTAVIGANNGAAGDVIIGGTVNAGKVVFTNAGSGSYVLSGGTLNLGGATPEIGASTNARVTADIAGTAGLAKTGVGTLTLDGAKSYSGTTVVGAGVLAVAGPTTPVTNNLLAWFDAADASTITKDGGNLVSAWASKGSYTGSATASGSARPVFVTGAVNGRPAIRFDGTLQGLTNAGILTAANFANSNASLFVVWTPNNDTDYDVLCTDGNSSQYWRWAGGGYGYWALFRSARWPTLTTPTNGTHMFRLVTSSTGSPYVYRIWVDGAFVDLPWTAGPAEWRFMPDLRIGYGRTDIRLNGTMSEVLIYNSALSDTDRATVEAYLNNKWFGTGAYASSAADLLPTNSAVQVASGATLDLSRYANQRVTSLADNGGGGGALVVGSGTLTLGDGNSATFSGSVTGVGGLTKLG
ncbi:MAG: autotransporter-associated beta strand repeat-containing protein, partial [Kiritimatiellae bacterium]|nr:autotransporter-associated beta strand repeat-containing protein [Kiritimatiellia bacterium]